MVFNAEYYCLVVVKAASSETIPEVSIRTSKMIDQLGSLLYILHVPPQNDNHTSELQHVLNILGSRAYISVDQSTCI